MWFSVTTALVYMLTASVFFALSGVAVHGLGSGGWDIALLSRALFGLPFALFIFLSGPKAECHWNSFAILLRSTSAVIFLAMLYFILELYSPGESFTLASMRPLWVAGLSMAFGLGSVRFIFWPLSLIGVVGIALMEGSRISAGLGFVMLALIIGFLGGLSTLAIDYCRGQSASFMTLHLTMTMLIIAVVSVVINGHVEDIPVLMQSKRDLLLYSVAGLGGTVYQIFSVLTVKRVGSIAGSVIALMSALFAWMLGHLIWNVPSNALSVLGILLALSSCVYMVLGGSLTCKTS